MDGGGQIDEKLEHNYKHSGESGCGVVTEPEKKDAKDRWKDCLSGEGKLSRREDGKDS